MRIVLKGVETCGLPCPIQPTLLQTPTVGISLAPTNQNGEFFDSASYLSHSYCQTVGPPLPSSKYESAFAFSHSHAPDSKLPCTFADFTRGAILCCWRKKDLKMALCRPMFTPNYPCPFLPSAQIKTQDKASKMIVSLLTRAGDERKSLGNQRKSYQLLVTFSSFVALFPKAMWHCSL